MKLINADLLRKEIERRITDNTFGAKLELIDILAWLDTLSEEPDKSLEEEVKRYLREKCSGDDEPTISEIARHFAEWQREQMNPSGSSEIPNDLEEAAEEYEKKHTYQRYDGGGLTPEYDETLAEAFIAGAKWQKEQMMKDAVSVQVVGEQRDLRLINSTQRCLFDAKRGDWLEIIIVKEV